MKDQIIKLIVNYCDKHSVLITAMESDIDHIHILIDCKTNINPHKFVQYLKQSTTFHIWKVQEKVLARHFWKERTFWSDGYFCCTVGGATLATVKEYINNQG